MEVLIVILFAVILIIVVNHRNSYNKQSRVLQEEIRQLRELIVRMNRAAKPANKESPQPAADTPPVAPKIAPPPPRPYEKSLEDTLVVLPDVTQPTSKPAAPVTSQPIPGPVNLEKKQPVPPVVPVTPVQRTAKPGFFERNPDLEKFIGENLVSKIGIAILVLAIGFFVKYAIDNDWIGHTGRVAVGVLCGSILIAIAHRLHQKYHAFSSVLVGGGLAIFYFTVALGYHEYQLFPQSVTFVMMLVITAFAVLLSILYNRQELAIISLVGGFATPFMASSGTGSYISLFIYLIILNSGLLVLAYKKAWRLLNLLAFIFTVLLFTSWLLVLFDKEPPQVYRNGLLFASIFYLMFLLINIAHNISRNKKFIASDFGILLANTCLYFSAGLYLSTKLEVTEYRGLFTAVMAAFNMALSYLLFRSKKADPNILYLLIGITLTFVSLTAPIQLKGNHITLFWSCEGVLIYWLYQKSRFRIMQVASIVVSIAAILSLAVDWVQLYGGGKIIPIVFNKAFITTVWASASFFALTWLYQQEQKSNNDLSTRIGKVVYFIAAIVLLYLGGTQEIIFQFTYRLSGIVGWLYWLGYTLLFVAALGTLIMKKPSPAKARRVSVLYIGCILLFLLQYGNAVFVQRDILQNKISGSHFIVHWLSAANFVWILLNTVKLIRSSANAQRYKKTLPWLTSLVAVIFLSVEFGLLSNTVFYSNENTVYDIQRVYKKAGLPILWGISSFVLMWLGMKHKNRSLRIISLVLFGITLLKLFIFDIRNIPVAGKIAAFFCLGVLLLIVSFMYQRLKKIITEDEKPRIQK